MTKDGGTESRFDGGADTAEMGVSRRQKFGTLLHSDRSIPINQDEDNYYSHGNRNSSVGSPRVYDRSPRSGDATPSPYYMSPLNQASPYRKSPWIRVSPLISFDDNKNISTHGLIGSIVREEGHIYSLAASGEFLYTGSDSKNVRVWKKNFNEFSGFKSSSGLVKSIIVSGEEIFTGHQDGKIRVWKLSPENHRNPYKRVGSLPTTKDVIKSSFNRKNYVEVRRRRNVPWIKHFDAVSSMCLDESQGILYSGSWDKTLKVWRLSDSKCLESINAHDDAINSVVAGFEGLVLTGSADGTVKLWRRDLLVSRKTKHVLVQTLLKQEYAVTALAVNAAAAAIYCGSSDGLVNFCEREKHLSHSGVLRGHKLAVLCLATAGNLVFSGSTDKTICVWRRDKGGYHSCLSVLTGHSGPVKCLAVEQDDHEPSKGDERWILYSGSLDKSVKVWRVPNYAPDMKHFRGL